MVVILGWNESWSIRLASVGCKGPMLVTQLHQALLFPEEKMHRLEMHGDKGSVMSEN